MCLNKSRRRVTWGTRGCPSWWPSSTVSCTPPPPPPSSPGVRVGEGGGEWGRVGEGGGVFPSRDLRVPTPAPLQVCHTFKYNAAKNRATLKFLVARCVEHSDPQPGKVVHPRGGCPQPQGRGLGRHPPPPQGRGVRLGQRKEKPLLRCHPSFTQQFT